MPFSGYLPCGCINVQDEQKRCVQHMLLRGGPTEVETKEIVWRLIRDEKQVLVDRVAALENALSAYRDPELARHDHGGKECMKWTTLDGLVSVDDRCEYCRRVDELLGA